MKIGGGSFIHFYIDGEYKNRYSYSYWTSSGNFTLEQSEHEFTWVLYCPERSYYSCIDQITIDDVVITDYNKFSNNYTNELKSNNNSYKHDSSVQSTPFYNDKPGIKIVSLKETCNKISFYYITYYANCFIHFYIPLNS